MLFIRGASGVGKSLLLRALAYLDPLEVGQSSIRLSFATRFASNIGPAYTVRAQGGTLTLDGLTPEQISVPTWRARVTYVPQTRVLNKGTPSELYFAAQVLHKGM